jgi:hypothetical protein
MLAWLIGFLNRLLGREERGLFRYWDGVKQRAIDPVMGWRNLMNDPDCQLRSDSAVAINPTLHDGKPMYPITEVLAAEDRMRELTRKVFGVKEWREDQPGLTADETDGVLNGFLDYCHNLKKKRNPLPTASAPTASKAPASSLDGAGFPAGSGRAYSCSPSESNDAAPTGP